MRIHPELTDKRHKELVRSAHENHEVLMQACNACGCSLRELQQHLFKKGKFTSREGYMRYLARLIEQGHL